MLRNLSPFPHMVAAINFKIIITHLQRDCLMHLLPELDLSQLRRTDDETKELLLKLDEKAEQIQLKVGVLLCRAGQSTEEEMYNNEHSSELFDNFLKIIGTKINLAGWLGFRAGLDIRGGSTGTHSVHTVHRETEIMFHVSTMLPFSKANRQQVDRKRHIGNDVITIIFQEPGAAPFSPAGVRSQFQHIFIIVRAHCKPSNSSDIRYSIAVARAKCVPEFGPPLPCGPCFTSDDLFRDFLLTKIVNGRNAVPRVGKFATLGTDMRLKFLRDILQNHSMEGPVDGSSSRFSILPFRRSEKRRHRVPAEIESRGGIVWPVDMLISNVAGSDDSKVYSLTLAVSHELLTLIIQPRRDDVLTIFGNLVPGTGVFSIPPRAILGWTLLGTIDIVIYYGTGDSFQFSLKSQSDRTDLITRLDCVSRGSHGLYPPATESKIVVLTRPMPRGQLGFHISYEGFVNQVDKGSAADKAGLKRGSRIVEICGRPLSRLTHQGQH